MFKNRNFQSFAAATLSLLLFIALLLFWGSAYRNHLLQKEQMQLFQTSFDYFLQHISTHGGFAAYLGEFFTQFFAIQWVGPIFLAILITSLQIGIQLIFKNLHNDNFNILSLIPALGYAFLLTNDFYLLAGAIALSITIWLFALYLHVSQKFSNGIICSILFITSIYWLLGVTYIVFAICLIFTIFIKSFLYKTSSQRNFYSLTIAVLSLVFLLPLINRHFISICSVGQAFTSTIYYKFSLLYAKPLIYLMLAIPVITLLTTLLHKSSIIKHIVNIVAFVSILTLTIIGLKTIPNYFEEEEMMYSNLVNNKQWGQIIQQAQHQEPAGREGKLAVMLALSQTQLVGDYLMSFHLFPTDFFIPYKIQGQAPLISNEPYFYLGMINYSQMLAMESIESSPDAISPVRAIKRYAETCIITGQYQIAEKYLRMLQQTLFYKAWANDAMAYLYNDEKVNAHPLWGKLRMQQIKDHFYLDVMRIEIAYYYLLKSDQQNHMAFDYLMASCLLYKNMDNFATFFPLFNHLNLKTIPKAYQETLAYLKSVTPNMPEQLSQFTVDANINARLELYAKAFNNGGNQNEPMMKQMFGDTYWYYLHFSKIEGQTQNKPASGQKK